MLQAGFEFILIWQCEIPNSKIYPFSLSEGQSVFSIILLYDGSSPANEDMTETLRPDPPKSFPDDEQLHIYVLFTFRNFGVYPLTER